jgi:para-nitrobenzyl esterase
MQALLSHSPCDTTQQPDTSDISIMPLKSTFPPNRLVCTVIAALLAFTSNTLLAASNDGLQIKTKQGKVEGTLNGSVRTFLGIPYAAPPIGPLRWKAPQAAAKWSGVREAKSFGPHCMQPKIYSDMIFRDPGGSEDCLTLNVWTPAKAKSAKLPVMVWIYGGGYLAGGTSEPRQDGTNLATKHDVIVVSMNYRLGIFGFFANAELAAESRHGSAGNYGLMDQAAALEWVQKNIKEFGGDPDNVTIFGESAGSFSVSALMASPLGKGLFRRAIGESGGGFNGAALAFKPLTETEARDREFAQTELSATTLEQLRAIPAEQLVDAAQKKPAQGPGYRFSADVDGYFLPESIPAIFAAHRQNDVPLLAGWNRDEAGVVKDATVESLKTTLSKDFPDRTDEAAHVYAASDDTSAVRAATDLAADRFIAYSTWKWMEAQIATGKAPVYRYRFDLAPPADPNHPIGLAAYHSAEIAYVFGNLDRLQGYAWRPEDYTLSDAMQSYWTNFAKTGDPNGGDLAKWPVYSPDAGWQVMHLSPQSEAAPDATRPHDLFLERVWGN